ncbi:MAG: hypothetical protein HRF43_09430 [Phycisphaerae bacterium]
MFRVAQHRGAGTFRLHVSLGVAWLAGGVLLAGGGCGQETWTTSSAWRESGYSDQGKTQVLFHAPPGASVTVRDPRRSHEIAPANAFANRLERAPEEECIFNLAPGVYEFKYTSADGLPGVSVYGELDVKNANTAMARIYQRRAYVPIALPSEHYRRTEVIGNETFPYRGENYRTAIDENDLARLRAGDVVEKVFVVADLRKAEKARRYLEQEIAVTERKLEYADARFKNAYLDFSSDMDDPAARFWGTDRAFIKWQERQVELQQRLEKLEDRMKRVQAILKADTVLTREGLLLVATDEVVMPHKDAEDASEDIGEVLMVMRLGGRHMRWGEPGRELAGYQPAGQ